MAPFDTTFGLGKRGAYGDLPPILGSSNLSKAIPLAGRYGAVLQAGNNPFPAATAVGAAQAVPGVSQSIVDKYGGINAWDKMGDQTKAAIIRQQGDLDLVNTFRDPLFQKQQLNNALAFYEAQGDQQMKYRKENYKMQMLNDIIANIGSGVKAAVSQYSDPAALAASLGTVGDSYARASASTAHLAQLGAGQPSRQYFTA
jgi:hypothetical protein